MAKDIGILKDFESCDYWTSPKIVLKSVGPKLVPFFKTVAIYFVLALPRDKPSCLSGLIKCLPILWLCIFVLLHGMSLADKHTYSRRILLGLAWSALGDFLLIWPWGFIWGMLAFAIAHVFYIWAFGMKPLNHAVGGVCLVATLLINYLLYPGYQGMMLFLVPTYSFILMFMVWRAIARVQLFNELWTWTKLCSCGGGFLFALSDGLLGITLFAAAPASLAPYAASLVMLLYYAGQLGIALSVVDCETMLLLSAAHSTPPSCRPARPQSSSAKSTSLRHRLTSTH